MNDRENIEILIFKYLQGDLSEGERENLERWLKDGRNKRVFSRLVDKHRIMAKMERLGEYDWQRSWSHMEGKLHGRKRLPWMRWVVAASVFGIVALGLRVFFHGEEDSSSAVAEGRVVPGMSYAELVLPDGKVVELHRDSTRVFLAENGNSLKNENGVLFFSADTGCAVQRVEYSEVRTPRGGEYQVILPDGTVVWLNSESKLRFPTTFPGSERRVSASGELYFQVARDSLSPFRIEVEGVYEVEVLGTEFNVRAYAGLPSATTLIKGSVVVHDVDSVVQLKPGEQLVKSGDGREMSVREVDVTSYVAWKSGYFLFENERLEDILSELARWYNVDVFYENQSVREERFSVDIRRHENFEEVLRLIERTGTVRIAIKENCVFVK
jgi:hypothetical protein